VWQCVGSVCCSVLQCVVVCCSVLQCVAVCGGAVVGVHFYPHSRCGSVLRCVAMCCSMLQYVAVSIVKEPYRVCGGAMFGCGSVLEVCVAVCCSVWQCVAVCCSVLQCVVVCCRVLQCVASVLQVCCKCVAVYFAKEP